MSSPFLYPLDSTRHTDFAFGLGQLGLSWMYDIIIIIINILPCGCSLCTLYPPCPPPTSPQNHTASVTKFTVPRSSWGPQDVSFDFLLSEPLFLTAQSMGCECVCVCVGGRGRPLWGAALLPGVIMLFFSL